MDPAREEKANRRPRRKELKETESRRVVPAPLRPLVESIEPKTQGKPVVAFMDQSRTLACEVVDNGNGGERNVTRRPRVYWTLGREIFGCR